MPKYKKSLNFTEQNYKSTLQKLILNYASRILKKLPPKKCKLENGIKKYLSLYDFNYHLTWLTLAKKEYIKKPTEPHKRKLDRHKSNSQNR